MDGDAVEEEDDGCGQHHGVEDSETDPAPAEFVDELCVADSFRLETCNGEFFLCGREPDCCFGTVGEDEEAYYAEDGCCGTCKVHVRGDYFVYMYNELLHDDVSLTLDCENHAP